MKKGRGKASQAKNRSPKNYNRNYFRTRNVSDHLDCKARDKYSSAIHTYIDGFPDFVLNIHCNIVRSLFPAEMIVSPFPIVSNRRIPVKSSNVQHHAHHLRQKQKRISSARELCKILSSILISPMSVCDIGCGYGFFLSAASEAWALQGLVGVDGDWIQKESLLFDPCYFFSADIGSGLSRLKVLDQEFDLVACLEVAEHLPPSKAPGLVSDLVRLSGMVLFSAAIPGQGGKGHVNEQYLDYWSGLFEESDYVAVDILHPLVWTNPLLLVWLRQNLMLFVRKDLAEQSSLFSGHIQTNHSILRRVHPDMFESKLRQLASKK